MKVLSILALALFITTHSFAEEHKAAAPAAGGEKAAAAAPAADGKAAAAPAEDANAKGKKKKHKKKK